MLSSSGDSTRNHPQSHQDLGDSIVAVQANVPLLSHDHSGTGSRITNKLAQANTHQSPDTDTATTSLHHTIGTSATQAAAGDHTHTIPPVVVPSVRVRLTSNLPIANALDTIIGWQAADWNTDSAGPLWVVGTPNNVTIKTAGKYRITLLNNWNKNNIGIRSGKVLLNGTGNANAILLYTVNALTDAGVETCVSATTEYQLNVNDVLVCDVFQSSGSSLSLINTVGSTSSSVYSSMTVTWIQP